MKLCELECTPPLPLSNEIGAVTHNLRRTAKKSKKNLKEDLNFAVEEHDKEIMGSVKAFHKTKNVNSELQNSQDKEQAKNHRLNEEERKRTFLGIQGQIYTAIIPPEESQEDCTQGRNLRLLVLMLV